MQAEEVFAVILAGGSGTRFWPASRKALPKQFLRIVDERSMLRATYERLAGLVPPERVIVVTGREHTALVRDELPELPHQNILGEPIGRNTLACTALAAFEVERRAPDAVQIVMPSDHVIEPVERLRASLATAIELAREEDVLALFGIRPTHPATGYGYIELGAPRPGWEERQVHGAARFVEKPDEARARSFLASGRFLWNSGIFVWRTPTFRRALFEHAPREAALLERVRPAELAAVYAELPAQPVDVGVIEKARNVCVLPIDYRWSDVGSWAALADVLPADGAGNVSSGTGTVLAREAADCIVHAQDGALVALIGVRDLVVVQAGGATLVCPRERAQEVKQIVAALEERDPRWS